MKKARRHEGKRPAAGGQTPRRSDEGRDGRRAMAHAGVAGAKRSVPQGKSDAVTKGPGVESGTQPAGAATTS